MKNTVLVILTKGKIKIKKKRGMRKEGLKLQILGSRGNNHMGKVTFEYSPRRNEGICHVDTWRKSIPGKK